MKCLLCKQEVGEFAKKDAGDKAEKEKKAKSKPKEKEKEEQRKTMLAENITQIREGVQTVSHLLEEASKKSVDEASRRALIRTAARQLTMEIGNPAEVLGAMLELEEEEEEEAKSKKGGRSKSSSGL